MDSNSVVEASANSVASEPAFTAIEKACKNVLVSWPNAKAAVLFGSRARGDHHEDSDWDIAFITNTEESLPCAALQDLGNLEPDAGIHIQAQAISQERFHDGADALGNIARGPHHCRTLPMAKNGKQTHLEIARIHKLAKQSVGAYRFGIRKSCNGH